MSQSTSCVEAAIPFIQRETEDLPRRDTVPSLIAWAVLSRLVTSDLGPTLGFTWGHCSSRMALLRPKTTPGLLCGLIALPSHHCQRNHINPQLSLPLLQIPRWLPRADRIRHSLPPSIQRPPQHGTNLPSSSSSSLSGLCSAGPVLSHLHAFARASSPSRNALAVPVTVLLVPTDPVKALVLSPLDLPCLPKPLEE